MFLTFELPKLTFSSCGGCEFTSGRLQIGTVSFITFCNILILKCENMDGYLAIISFSQALEISRQYLLLRTDILQNIVAGCP